MSEQLESVRAKEGSIQDLRALPTISISDRSTYVSLRAYLDLLIGHEWLILSITLIGGVLAAIYSFRMKPVYRATAVIEIEPQVPLIQSLNDLFREMPRDDGTFVATQVDVLMSDTLAWQTIQQLQVGPIRGAGGTGRDDARTAGYPVEAEAALTRAFLSHLNVQWKQGTRIVMANYEETDPKQAARIVNALIDNYIAFNLRLKYDATREATTWMEQQLGELKAKVTTSEQEMVDYERKNSIVNIGDKQSVAEQRLQDLSRELTAVQTDRLNRESVYRLLTSDQTAAQFATLDPLLQQLESKEADLREQYAAAAAQYGSAFPKLNHLKGQLAEVDSLIERERRRIIERARNDYLTSRTREAALSDAVAKQKEEVGRLSQLLIQDNLLKREFQTNQQLYESLLQHLKDATISAGLKATNIHRIDRELSASLHDST